MTTTLDSEPLTAASVLAAGADLPVDRLAGLLEEAEICAEIRAAQALEDTMLKRIEQQLAQHAANILDTDLLQLLFTGWGKWRSLQNAARTSLQATEPLKARLAAHRVESRQAWTVVVRLYSLKLTKADFILTTVFDIDAPEAQLQAGRLVGLTGGRCELTVRFEVCAECVPAECRRPALEARRVIDLDTRISFGKGIAVLSSAEAAG